MGDSETGVEVDIEEAGKVWCKTALWELQDFWTLISTLRTKRQNMISSKEQHPCICHLWVLQIVSKHLIRQGWKVNGASPLTNTLIEA